MDREMLLVCVLLIIGQALFKCCGDPLFSVSPSTNVLVNQKLTLQCLFSTGQLGVSIKLPGNIECAFAYCLSTTCMGNPVTPECPNNRTYSISLTATASWNKGVLYCRPPFSNTRSNNVTMDIRVPVNSVTLNPAQVTVNAGKSITVTCQTDYCNPAANITWFKSSYDITGLATRTTDVNSNGLVRTTSVLQYTFIREDNDQLVYCTASNIEGQSVNSSISTLDVRYISEVRVLPFNTLYVVAGQRQVLVRCYVLSANPGNNVEYRWTKISGMTSSIVSTTQIYVIETADVSDSGRYSCTASNSAGNSSGYVDINVQYTPLSPAVVQAVCKSSHAFIIWTSLYPVYDEVQHQETLQISDKDSIFINTTFETLNNTKPDVHIYKVNALKPMTEYLFRVMVSNQHGTTFSNKQSCITDTESVEESSGGCDVGQIVGGTVGGAMLIAVLVSTAVLTLYKYREVKARKGKSSQSHREQTDNISNRQQGASYVGQLSPGELHQYQGIYTDTTSETQMPNVYEKVEESNPPQQSVKYVDLSGQYNTDEGKNKGVLYSNIT